MLLIFTNISCEEFYIIEIDLLNDFIQYLKNQINKTGFFSVNGDPIYAYFNLLKRLIEPKPRKVVKSKEFSYPKEYDLALEELENKITIGQNLTPYMGTEIKNAEYNDRLLNDWNIYHFHLSRRVREDGFVQRSNYQVFAYITEDVCYLIQVYPHNKPHLYATQEIVKIIDDNWPELISANKMAGRPTLILDDNAYDTLRSANISAFVQTESDTMFGMIGGGYSSNGYSLSALRQANHWIAVCMQIQKRIINGLINDIAKGIKKNCLVCGHHFKFSFLFFKNYNSIFLAEEYHHIVVEINYKDKWVRICNPIDIFPRNIVAYSKLLGV